MNEKVKYKIVFMGSIPLAVPCLRFLAGREDIEVLAAETMPADKPRWWEPPYVDEVARELGLELRTEKLPLPGDIDNIIVVGHDRILKKDDIAAPRYGVINLHLAPLPEYRGCNGHAHAIINGEKEYGVTLHLIDEGIDTGPILAQRRFLIPPDATARELYYLSEEVAYSMFCDVIPDALAGKVKPAQQGEGKYYYGQQSLANNEVYLSWDPRYIYNFVRGMTFPPFERPYIRLGEKKVYLEIERKGIS